jgi:hypothetical protein
MSWQPTSQNRLENGRLHGERRADVDATHGLDHLVHAVEVDDHRPVERHLGEVVDGLGGQIGATVGEGGVDLVLATAPAALGGDVDVAVARNRDDECSGPRLIDVDNHDGVRPRTGLVECLGFLFRARVRTQHEEIHRLVFGDFGHRYAFENVLAGDLVLVA